MRKRIVGCGINLGFYDSLGRLRKRSTKYLSPNYNEDASFFNRDVGYIPEYLMTPEYSYPRLLKITEKEFIRQASILRGRDVIMGPTYIIYETPRIINSGIDFGYFKLQLFIDNPGYTLYLGGSLLENNYCAHTNIHQRAIDISSFNKAKAVCYGAYKTPILNALLIQRDLIQAIEITNQCLMTPKVNDGVSLIDEGLVKQCFKCNKLYNKKLMHDCKGKGVNL